MDIMTNETGSLGSITPVKQTKNLKTTEAQDEDSKKFAEALAAQLSQRHISDRQLETSRTQEKTTATERVGGTTPNQPTVAERSSLKVQPEVPPTAQTPIKQPETQQRKDGFKQGINSATSDLI